MIIQANVLRQEDLLAIREGLSSAAFRDGRATAGAAAGRVKDNAQARGNDPGVIALARRVRLALEAHPVVRSWVRPVRWSQPMFARYGPGQHYGAHTDAAFVYNESGRPVRTDISFTLFLSDPGAYDGGELLISDPAGDRQFRPAAGSAIFYTTGQLHSVTPVTRGERLVCVGWVQSLIRRSDQRELLNDLEQVRDEMESGHGSLLMDKAIGNLLRMWGED
ncbi:Fe2+-dependent dioxygenase [Sphingomonas radiodurans]|uniref:Fe2+-dependent dioxygenase n=1 Tax=Sphingomonas radiodurans TaxID=2890321 RepID=UPI001E45AA4B|nr:Fe2+-dependent dioxygenase [Sphingomonas radiodurans]WBH15075.1 Fe2+-dependent dioxygenase [Sphingomonas radiodurans]